MTNASPHRGRRLEDPHPSRTMNRMCAVWAGGERDQLSRLKRAFAAPVAQERSAGEHVEPFLDPVVVVIGPTRFAGVDLIDSGADHLRIEPFCQLERREAKRALLEYVARLTTEDVDDVHAAMLSRVPSEQASASAQIAASRPLLRWCADAFSRGHSTPADGSALRAAGGAGADG